MRTFYKGNKMKSCSQWSVLFRQRQNRQKKSGEETAMEKKQSQEIVKGETVFQEEKQWHSVARVGLFCWDMELD